MVSQAYRLGQVAKTVGCSTYKLRRLCEAGLIDAELTGKGQWRIPAEECARLEQEGLPDIPAKSIEHEDDLPTKTAALSLPRAAVVEANSESEAVQEERNHVAIADARLKRRRLELEQEDVEDAFAERAQRRLEPVLAAQRRREEADRAAARQEWREKWLTHASKLIPHGCSASIRLQVHDAAERLLDRLGMQESDGSVRRLVETTVESNLQEFHRNRRIEQAISNAVDHLPAGARRDEPLRLQAAAAARKAVTSTASHASEIELFGLARQAVAPITRSYEEEQTKRDLLQAMSHWRSWEAKAEEREEATEALKEVLAEAPRGTSSADLRRLRDETIAPFDRAVEVKKQRERARRDAEEEADQALTRIAHYLRQNYDFDSWSEQRETETELTEELRPKLIKRFLDGRLQDQAEAREYVEEAIDTLLDEDD